MRILPLAAAVLVFFPYHVLAQQACVQGTLAYYISLATSGCRLGTVVFSHFGQPIPGWGAGVFKPWIVGPNGSQPLTPDDVSVTPIVVSASRIAFTLRPTTPLTLAAGGNTGLSQSAWDWGIGFLANPLSTTLTGMTWSGKWSAYSIDRLGNAPGYSEAGIGSTATYKTPQGDYNAQFATAEGSSASHGDYSYSFVTPTPLPGPGAKSVYWHASAAASAGGGRSASLSDPEFLFELDLSASVVPEPSAISLMGLGLAAMGAYRRRPRK